MRALLSLASKKDILAIRALGGFRDSELVRDTLLRYLEDVDDNVMAAAIEALGDLALPVLERINRRKITEHRWSYGDILWKVAHPKNPKAVEILLEAFKVRWLQKLDSNGNRKYGTGYPAEAPSLIAGALRVLKEHGAVKAEDASAVDEVLGLFPCNYECYISEYATAWQLTVSPIPYDNNCVSPTDEDSRNRRLESLTNIIAHPDKRLTAALLHSLHNYIYDGLIFHGTDDYEFVTKDQTILKYQAALEALNDEVNVLYGLQKSRLTFTIA